MSYSIGKKLTENLVKVEVNDFGDYIMLDPGDSSFQKRFLDLIKWVDDKQKELNKIAEEKGKKYENRKLIAFDDDGEAMIDIEQLSDLVEIQNNFYRECRDQINNLFGQETLEKYFRVCYEINPAFLPDEDCIADFLDEITPVLNQVYNARFERIKGRYNKNRKGKNTKPTEKVVPISNE